MGRGVPWGGADLIKEQRVIDPEQPLKVHVFYVNIDVHQRKGYTKFLYLSKLVEESDNSTLPPKKNAAE
jgi:hypothetical protein